MRRIVLGVLGMIAIVGAQAQGARVLNAWGYMEDNEFLKAKEEIEPATTHPKTMEQGKTWYYRGMIYENIYVRSTKPEEFPDYAGMGASSLMEAKNSYSKAIGYGSKRIDMGEVNERYARLANPFFQEGVNLFNAQDFEGASNFFEQSFLIRKQLGTTDSLAAYNVALAAARIPNQERAIEYYTITKDLGYRPATVYPDLARLYLDMENTEKAQEVLAEGREKMPNNQDLITAELNIYLERKEFDKALNNLNLAIQNDPENRVLHYARGSIFNEQYDNLYSDTETREKAMESFAFAERDYKSAIGIDEGYFDALFNLGALYFNRGAELLNEANLISDDDEYKKAKDAATAELKKSLPYLEKAHEVNPEDKSTMLSLRDIYGRTNMVEKYDAMSEKIDN